ncbi:conserved hypothetical protein (plasmid) [Paraburkholderia phymatum STM815]|uniref:Fis family transcriptional regulator n=2 Tax=Paraburkholderia TaxID=1822464 RepID=B2JXE1_PARP8|nr:conserved hypothetical protein [Paraburkholderia phymatum STM815]
MVAACRASLPALSATIVPLSSPVSSMSRSSFRSASRRTSRKPRTREQLLPLPASKVRALSLEHHLALTALRGGHGSVEQMSVLLKVVYLVYFMAQAVHDPVDPGLLRTAEAALQCCGLRGHHQGCWTLSEADHDVLAQVLTLHDGQLGALPSFRYADGWARIHAFLASDAQSPLPDPADA